MVVKLYDDGSIKFLPNSSPEEILLSGMLSVVLRGGLIQCHPNDVALRSVNFKTGGTTIVDESAVNNVHRILSVLEKNP